MKETSGGRVVRPKIYLFGDSITELSFGHGGWGASLANHFSRTADVVVRGYSGYNTRWALMGIHKVFPPPPAAAAEDESTAAPPLFVTVLFGANDACLPDRYSGYLHVPIDEYKQHLHSMVSFFKRRWPSTHVILITPPPIDEATRYLNRYGVNKGESPEPERTNEWAGNYAKACVSVASECGVPAIDIWTEMQKTPGWQTAFLCDGLHLSPGGNGVVFEQVLGKLKELGVTLDTLPLDLPHFHDIDPSNPLISLS